MSFAQTIQYIYSLIFIYKKKEHNLFGVFSCSIFTSDKKDEKKKRKQELTPNFIIYYILFIC